MSHYWDSISTFEIKVIAQDENGTNSSWSLPLEVTVSQAASGEIPPTADINFSTNESDNLTIEFDASGSFDIDGNITDYFWDFGDGENGTGINPIHTYKTPGTYTVTLEITDNNNNTYSKSIIATVGSEAGDESEERGLPLFYVVIGVIGFAVAIFVCLMVFFRNNVVLFFSQHRIHLFSNRSELLKREKSEKLDAKIQGLKRMQEKIDYEKLPDVKMDKQPSEVVEEYRRTRGNIDSEVESTSEKKESSDDVYTQKKTDEDAIASIERKVDEIILSKTEKTTDKRE